MYTIFEEWQRRIGTSSGLLHIHAPLQRRFQIVVVATACGERFLGLRFLRLPSALLVVGDGHVGLLGNLLLLRGGLRLRLLPDQSPEAHYLVVDHVAHLLHVLDHLKVEVEGRRAGGLIRGVVPDVQVRMLKGLLNRDTRRRVERKHAIEQVESIGVGVGEQALEGDLGHERQVANVLLRTR